MDLELLRSQMKQVYLTLSQTNLFFSSGNCGAKLGHCQMNSNLYHLKDKGSASSQDSQERLCKQDSNVSLSEKYKVKKLLL